MTAIFVFGSPRERSKSSDDSRCERYHCPSYSGSLNHVFWQDVDQAMHRTLAIPKLFEWLLWGFRQTHSTSFLLIAHAWKEVFVGDIDRVHHARPVDELNPIEYGYRTPPSKCWVGRTECGVEQIERNRIPCSVSCYITLHLYHRQEQITKVLWKNPKRAI